MKTKSKIIVYGIVHTAIMLGVLIYTSLKESILDAGYLFSYPWYWGTLADTYLAFLLFFLWVCYIENKMFNKVIWCCAIGCLGNIAMGLYIILRAKSLSDTDQIKDFLTKRKCY